MVECSCSEADDGFACSARNWRIYNQFQILRVALDVTPLAASARTADCAPLVLKPQCAEFSGGTNKWTGL
jgi:hypothetical protein